MLCDPGDDDDENLEEMLESQDGLRGGERDVPGAAFTAGRAGGGFGEGDVDSAGGCALPFCVGAGSWSIGVGGSD